MKALFTIAGLSPEFGGPAYSVPALANAVAQLGLETELFTCQPSRGQGALKLPVMEGVKTHLLPAACRSTRWLPQTNPFVSALRDGCLSRKDCVIHDNGIWLPTNHAAAHAARQSGRPLIISPRGMLTPWALKQSSIYKFFGWRLYQRRDLQSAAVLHATSLQEAQEFRNLGLRPPIAVIPNGVALPPEGQGAEGGGQKSEIGGRRAEGGIQRAGFRTVLFLSRIHRGKGLIDLVQAWARIQEECGKQKAESRSLPWRVLIAGAGDGSHQAEVQALIARKQLEREFQFCGAVEGEAKWRLLRSADLFILPSHSENFGLVVAEALASGVPVITTRGTPWEELVTHRCGWWVEKNPDALAAALRDAMSRTDTDRREMGERGRQLVESKYTWAGVAEQMKAVYEWALGIGPKPDTVI